MYRTALTVQDWGFGVESQWACVAFFKLCLERLGRLELVCRKPFYNSRNLVLRIVEGFPTSEDSGSNPMPLGMDSWGGSLQAS